MQIFDYKSQLLKRNRLLELMVDNPLQTINENSFFDRFIFIKRTFPKVLLLGDFSEDFIERLKELGHGDQLIEQFDPITKFQSAEKIDFSWPTFNLILSSLHLHKANDVPGLMWQFRQLLHPDGMLIASLFGGESLIELRTAILNAENMLRGGVSNRVHPMINFGEASNLLMRAGFALPVADRDLVTFTYDNIYGLIKDLRNISETNTLYMREPSFAPRQLFNLVNSEYLNSFAENDKINVTVELIYLTGWAPHVSQQKALAPGSAKLMLHDVLNNN